MSKLFISLMLLACSPIFLPSQMIACQIIYLNGTSSVGKTTLANALQNELDTPYLLLSIDKVIDMMPAKVNNWEGGHAELGFSWKTSKDAEGNPLQILETGPFGAQMPKALRDISTALAKSNFYLIIDDVGMDDNSFTLWKTALQGHKVLWVGLTAPLEVIEKREKQRGDRQLGQARAAYNIVHKGYKYDLFLDTSKLSLADLVNQIKAACTESKKS